MVLEGSGPRIVVVTGGSSGFGAAIACAFAERGDVVYAGSRSPKDLKGVRAVELDIRDPSSRQRLLEQAGHVDVLVNNAGILDVNAWEDQDEADLRSIFETNVFGPIAMTRAVLPGMRQRGGGRVINMSAIAAVHPTPFLGAYSASKHALDAMSASLDGEVSRFGIRVSSVLPGPFHTGILQSMDGASEITGVYTKAVETYREGLRSRLEAGGAGYSRVVDAVLAAATDPCPRPRYLVAGERITTLLAPIVEQLNALST